MIGHILMLLLHIAALAVFPVALFLTIPFHILIGAVNRRR